MAGGRSPGRRILAGRGVPDPGVAVQHRTRADRVSGCRAFGDRTGHRDRIRQWRAHGPHRRRFRRPGRKLLPRHAVRAGGNGERDHRPERARGHERHLQLHHREPGWADPVRETVRGFGRIEWRPALSVAPGSRASVDHGDQEHRAGFSRRHLRGASRWTAPERTLDPRSPRQGRVVPPLSGIREARGHQLPGAKPVRTARPHVVGGQHRRGLRPRSGDHLQPQLPADRDGARGQRPGSGLARIPRDSPGRRVHHGCLARALARPAAGDDRLGRPGDRHQHRPRSVRMAFARPHPDQRVVHEGSAQRAV